MHFHLRVVKLHILGVDEVAGELLERTHGRYCWSRHVSCKNPHGLCAEYPAPGSRRGQSQAQIETNVLHQHPDNHVDLLGRKLVGHHDEGLSFLFCRPPSEVPPAWECIWSSVPHQCHLR